MLSFKTRFAVSAAALIGSLAAGSHGAMAQALLDPASLGSSSGGFGLENSAEPQTETAAGQDARNGASGWGSGSFEVKSAPVAPASTSSDRSGDDGGCSAHWLNLQGKRIDLAMSAGDLRRWASLMAEAINRGCSGPPIASRIARAETIGDAAESERDIAMASAARSGRPELRTDRPRSVGRSLDASHSKSSDWLEVAGFLTELASGYKAAKSGASSASPFYRDSSPARSRTSASNGQLTMQDVINDAVVTKQLNDDLEELGRDQRLPDTGESSGAGNSTNSPGGAASASGSPEGGHGSAPAGGAGGNCGPVSPDQCPPNPGIPGGVCVYCPDLYGLPGTYRWQDGENTPPSTLAVCRLGKSASIRNFAGDIYADGCGGRTPADFYVYQSVASTQKTRTTTIEVACGAYPRDAELITGPVRKTSGEYDDMSRFRDRMAGAISTAMGNCCDGIGADGLSGGSGTVSRADISCENRVYDR